MPEVNQTQNPQTTQPPQKPERNWKKIGLILLVALLLISLVGVGIYLLVPRPTEPTQTSTKKATPSAKISTSSSKPTGEKSKPKDETATLGEKWARTSSYPYFSFEYPLGWHIFIDSSEPAETKIWIDSVPIFTQLSEKPPGKISINDVDKKGTNLNTTLSNERKNFSNYKETTFLVDGVKIYKLVVGGWI